MRKFSKIGNKALTTTSVALLLVILTVFLCISLLFALFVLSYSARYRNVTLSPHNFPNTVWSTEDGKINFQVGEYKTVLERDKIEDNEYNLSDVKSQMFGTLVINGEEYKFFILYTEEYSQAMAFYSTEILNFEFGEGCVTTCEDLLEEYKLFEIDITKYEKQKFCATVIGGELLETDTKIVFFKNRTD